MHTRQRNHGDPLSAALPRDTTAAPDVSFIIANYNAQEFLSKCLTSVFAQRSSRSFEVLVVDDHSHDGSVEMVRRMFPRVQLFTNPRNLGYARSCNKAIGSSLGRYIYLLNNDIELLPETMDALVQLLERQPEVGAVGCALRDPDGTLQAASKALPTIRSAFFGGRSFLSRWFPGNGFTRRELLQWKVEAGVPFEAGYVSGASMLVRREELDRIGTLDEDLFYFNDADFCKRLWDAGRQVVCLPQAEAVHHEHSGGSMISFRQRFRSLKWFHLGAYRYYRKHVRDSILHPMSWFVIGALGSRFVAAGLLQLGQEAGGAVTAVVKRLRTTQAGES